MVTADTIPNMAAKKRTRLRTAMDSVKGTKTGIARTPGLGGGNRLTNRSNA
jgi:hypothetical protein